MLNGNHNTMCRFGDLQVDKDNLKIVQGFIARLYKAALKAGELRRVSIVASSLEVPALEARFSSLQQGEQSHVA
jgi:hypothetical protein